MASGGGRPERAARGRDFGANPEHGASQLFEAALSGVAGFDMDELNMISLSTGAF